MFFAFSRFMVLWRRIQKFFVLNDLIYKIFFSLERACQDAVHDVALLSN